MGPFTLITTTAENTLVDVPNWVFAATVVLLITAGLILLSNARGWFSWVGPWTALALVFVAVWVVAFGVGTADKMTERSIERVVQAEGAVASVEDTGDGVEVTLEEDDSRVLRFDASDVDLPARGEALTATCTDLEDPRALAECSEGPAPEPEDVAGDVTRTVEAYTD